MKAFKAIIMLENAQALAYMGMMSALEGIDLMKKDGPKSEHYAFFSVGAMNLIFSIEIYLKAIHEIHGTIAKKLKKHKLVDLYKDLPESVQNSIKLIYEAEPELEKFKIPTYILSVWDQAKGDEQETKSFSQERTNLPEVLELHNDGFVNWRYSQESESPRTLYVDFTSLYRLSEALAKEVSDIWDVSNIGK